MTEAALSAGVCSVTFRSLDTDAIIELASAAGAEGIEWGADVHVQPGDVREAKTVRRRCTDAGIVCPSYGSYHAPGLSDAAELVPVLDTAEALGAGTVRVWAPWGVGPGATDDEVAPIAAALAQAAEVAAARGLSIALEFHPGTLTETAASARRLLAMTGTGQVRSYWQPKPGEPANHATAELAGVLDRLAHLHVFSWDATGQRLPLAAGAELWTQVFTAAASAPRLAGGRYALLEFVAGDDPEAFRRDLAHLRAWLSRD